MSTGVRLDPVGRRLIGRDGRDLAQLRKVGEISLFHGPTGSIEYEKLVESAPGEWQGSARCALGDVTVCVEDRWLAGADTLRLERHVLVPAVERPVGLHVRTALALAQSGAERRPFVPANLYEAAQLPAAAELSYSDGRVSYPVIGVYDADEAAMIALIRADLASFDDGCARRRGETEYLHATDLGSVGLVVEQHDSPRYSLIADYPYTEGDGSAFLDSAGTPARAYLPVPSAGGTVVVRYLLADLAARDYAHGVRAVLERVIATQPPAVAKLPFSLQEAIELRRDSMAKTYVEWTDGGAGFVLNFDPDLGYASAPRAFGASFTEHGMERARDILEYGFTGRQLNVAHVLAAGGDPVWRRRRRRMCDFFVRAMVTDTGFCFSHYDVGEQRPLYSVGDPGGPVLHYLVTAGNAGSYLRLISEAAGDLLLTYQAAVADGEDVPTWRDALVRIADFLLDVQRPDGSWLRAYTPDRTAITGGAWLGIGDAATSATGAPIPFLVSLAAELPEHADRLMDSAERAGRFLLENQVRPAAFRGGTLDNPNVIDKESAFTAMAALATLHRSTGRTEYLDGAAVAAYIGASWTVLWDIPTVAGSRVHRAGVRSTGWGGINSIWGAGVTDIYSLFYLADLVYLADQLDDALLTHVAELSAHGTAQLLAHPGDRFEMADTGMQPEGIAHAGQGVDDGLINKGDTWGGLGWIYTAGTHGLGAYLESVSARPKSRHEATSLKRRVRANNREDKWDA